jgi:hypothetical protein
MGASLRRRLKAHTRSETPSPLRALRQAYHLSLSASRDRCTCRGAGHSKRRTRTAPGARLWAPRLQAVLTGERGSLLQTRREKARRNATTGHAVRKGTCCGGQRLCCPRPGVTPGSQRQRASAQRAGHINGGGARTRPRRRGRGSGCQRTRCDGAGRSNRPSGDETPKYKPHFVRTPLGGKTTVAQQRGRRPAKILAARNGQPIALARLPAGRTRASPVNRLCCRRPTPQRGRLQFVSAASRRKSCAREGGGGRWCV